MFNNRDAQEEGFGLTIWQVEDGKWKEKPKHREGRQEDVDSDQCAYCKEKGHWARECPEWKMAMLSSRD